MLKNCKCPILFSFRQKKITIIRDRNRSFFYRSNARRIAAEPLLYNHTKLKAADKNNKEMPDPASPYYIYV